LGDLMSMFSLQSNDSQSMGSRIMRKPRMLMHAHMHRLQRKLGRSMTSSSTNTSNLNKGQVGYGSSSSRTQADHSRPDGQDKTSFSKRTGQRIGAMADTKDRIKDGAGNLKEQVKDLPTNARYALYQGKSKVQDNVRDLTISITQTKSDRASGRKEQQEQRRKTIVERRAEMEKAKQNKNLLLLLIQDLPPNRKAMRNLIDNRNKSMCVLTLNKRKLMTKNPLDLPQHILTKLKHKRRK